MHLFQALLPRPEKECPELPDPDNGQVHLSGRHFQDQAVYTCDRGHTMVGASKRLCQVGSVGTCLDSGAITCHVADQRPVVRRHPGVQGQRQVRLASPLDLS